MTDSRLPDIRITRLMDDPIERVWKVVATPEGIASWFAPNQMKPVAGHRFHVEMEKPQGNTPCIVTKADPPRLLSYDLGEDWSWTFELKELQGQTELTFIWSGWDENKKTVFGMPHAQIHPQLTNGAKVLIKRLSRSVNKFG